MRYSQNNNKSSQNNNTNLNNILSNVILFSHIVLCSFIIFLLYQVHHCEPLFELQDKKNPSTICLLHAAIHAGELVKRGKTWGDVLATACSVQGDTKVTRSHLCSCYTHTHTHTHKLIFVKIGDNYRCKCFFTVQTVCATLTLHQT